MNADLPFQQISHEQMPSSSPSLALNLVWNSIFFRKNKPLNRFYLKREVWPNLFLALLLLWVTGVFLLLLSCDPKSTNSRLYSAIRWHGRATLGFGKFLTILLGYTQFSNSQLPPPLSTQLRIGVGCNNPLPLRVKRVSTEGAE